MPKPYRITIDLSAHQKVFERIKASAVRESRSLAGQLLYEVLPTISKAKK